MTYYCFHSKDGFEITLYEDGLTRIERNNEMIWRGPIDDICRRFVSSPVTASALTEDVWTE